MGPVGRGKHTRALIRGIQRCVLGRVRRLTAVYDEDDVLLVKRLMMDAQDLFRGA